MASSISAARGALYSLLAAADYNPPPDEPVQVTFGPPENFQEQEVVALLGLFNPDEQDAALGAQRHEETYDLEVALKKHDPAGNPDAVDARGFAMADIVRGVVHSNRTLGGAVRDARVISQTTDGVERSEGGGWIIFVRILVRCRQRIT